MLTFASALEVKFTSFVHKPYTSAKMSENLSHAIKTEDDSSPATAKTEPEENNVSFKPKKFKRPLRQRKNSDDEDEEDTESTL